jgi:glycoprotease/Kae1 family metallohydrolase
VIWLAVLGVESTAHTLGIGIFDPKAGRMLANEKDMHRPKGGGMRPGLAADHHAEVFGAVLAGALDKSGVKKKDISHVAYARGPGIGQCLKVGLAGASALASELGVKLVPVNHACAHVEVGAWHCKMKDPLVLYVSGGNTQIIVRQKTANKHTTYRVLGETLDVGVGNMIDVFARALGEEFAHGSVVEKIALGGKYVPMPYTVKGMNMTFTGLLTDAKKKLESGAHSREDLCFSLQETSFSMLTEAVERALALTGKKEVLACGGVAQNKRLCNMLDIMAREHGVRFGAAPGEFNADNGGMIAYAGWLARAQAMDWKKAGSDMKWRIDEVVL